MIRKILGTFIGCIRFANSSHSTYETSAAGGDWNVSKGILSQNNTFIGISFQKFYKSALTILAIRQSILC